MTIGTGFHTYEIERGPATGKWNIYRIAPDHQAFIGGYKTMAEAMAVVESLRSL